MIPSVTFEAETLEAVRERFPAAIYDIYDGTEELRPGQQRKHVFDFEDGLRLIVSRERVADSAGIHVSASASDDTSLSIHAAIRESVEAHPGVPVMGSAASAVDKVARERFRELSGYEGKFKMSQLSPSGVLHYFVPITVWGRG